MSGQDKWREVFAARREEVVKGKILRDPDCCGGGCWLPQFVRKVWDAIPAEHRTLIGGRIRMMPEGRLVVSVAVLPRGCFTRYLPGVGRVIFAANLGVSTRRQVLGSIAEVMARLAVDRETFLALRREYPAPLWSAEDLLALVDARELVPGGTSVEISGFFGREVYRILGDEESVEDRVHELVRSWGCVRGRLGGSAADDSRAEKIKAILTEEEEV